MSHPFDAHPRISKYGLMGIPIIENIRLVVLDGEDWSKVRSPSRAIRRRRQGHRQNITTKYKPDPTIYEVENKFVMHPAIAVKLRAEIAKRQETDIENSIYGKFYR